MASSSGYNYEIKNFDEKNFALWKATMQNLLMKRVQEEVIRHAMKLVKPTKIVDAEGWLTIANIEDGGHDPAR